MTACALEARRSGSIPGTLTNNQGVTQYPRVLGRETQEGVGWNPITLTIDNGQPIFYIRCMEWLAVLVPLAILGMLMLALSASGNDQYTPMTFDEEVRWLMEDCGLDREYAEELANIPHNRL